MKQRIYVVICFLWAFSLSALAQSPPTVADFWEGRAEWVIDIPDVGLPIGESDTVAMAMVYIGRTFTPATRAPML